MSKLLDYLNHLDQNADGIAAHTQDPHQAMDNFGLSDDEKQAMLSGDHTQVAQAIGISAAEMPMITVPQFINH
jgi:hypothetical protein